MYELILCLQLVMLGSRKLLYVLCELISSRFSMKQLQNVTPVLIGSFQYSLNLLFVTISISVCIALLLVNVSIAWSCLFPPICVIYPNGGHLDIFENDSSRFIETSIFIIVYFCSFVIFC